MKVILITGTSTGIGYEASLAFARAGNRVISTMRNTEKAQNLKAIAEQEKLNIDVRQLDVTNVDEVSKVVDAVVADFGCIDVLINNAGAGFLGTLEQTSLSQARQVMDVNYWGVWHLTQAVLPYMREKGAGHIVTISSIGGLVGQPFNDAYCAAKFAVEGLMESLAPVAKRLGVNVSLIEPGAVNTEFVETVRGVSPAANTVENDSYSEMLSAYTAALTEAFASMGQTPDEIAKLLVEVVASPEPNLRYQTSQMSNAVAKLKIADPSGNAIVAMTEQRLQA